MVRTLNRRRMLRGMLAGGAVTLGLPVLDAMLNTNGDAFAATGKPIPNRFAGWFWPLGLGEGGWVPEATGANYELADHLSALNPMKKKMNFYTGTQVFLDGAPNETHFTAVQGYMTGKVTKPGEFFGSIDTLIADAIGPRTRFSTLQAACSGEPRACYTGRLNSGIQTAEVSPTALYMRIFGPEYVDPNAATFTPDPGVQLRRSVLSVLSDDRHAIMNEVGAADRAKLDSYFTSLRALEQKLEVQLEKPDPMEACTKPAEFAEDDGREVATTDEALARHELFTQLFVHAIACDQTRAVNLAISTGLSGLRRTGDFSSHHTFTHEEAIDPVLGYQPTCGWFVRRYMEALQKFAAAFDAVKEGDKTLLDRMIVFAFTDHGAPRLHTLKNMPFFTFGSADGRLKTGLHVSRPGDISTRISYTIQQAMGVPVSAWGSGSNRVNSPIAELLV